MRYKRKARQIVAILMAVLMVVAVVDYRGVDNIAAISYRAEYGKEIESGDCGKTEADSLKWTVYDSDGDNSPDTLVISGTGNMADYRPSTQPWNSYKTSLTKLVLDEGVTSIGEYAFFMYNGLTGNLTIPSSVTSIGNWAFSSCSGFNGSLTILEGVKSIGTAAFSSCSGFNGNLTIPSSVTSIGEYAFYNCIGFNGSLTISEGVTSIGHGTFGGCSGFTGNLTMPDSITSIGNFAFQNCSKFTGNLTIPSSVTSIGNNAFEECRGFTGNLTIPEGVTSIGNSAFSGCEGFNGSLTILEGVTSIGDDAFYGCEKLDNVSIEARTTKEISLGVDVFLYTGVPLVSLAVDNDSEAALLKVLVDDNELMANDGTYTIPVYTVNKGIKIAVTYTPYDVASVIIDNNETRFTDLQKAMDSITGNQTASIKLLRNVNLKDKSLNLTGSNKKITLDTNTFTLTGNNAVDGTIVISGSNTLNITGAGTVENTGTDGRALSIKAGSNVTIAEGTTVTGNVLNYGTLVANGTITGTTENHSQIKNDIEANQATIVYGSDTETVSEGGVTTIHAKTGDKVTFSATALGNYTVSGLADVKDANGAPVEVTKEAESDAYGKPNNTVNYSFAMPDTAVTISISLRLFEETNLAGYSLSLSGNIGVNFYMELAQDVINDKGAYMHFTLPNDKTKDVSVANATPTLVSGKTYYVFSCEVAAKEMTSMITAQMIFSNDKKGTVYTYTVKEYADYILEHPTEYEKALPLVKAMLNYGGYAQTYFDYQLDNLANASLTDDEKLLGKVDLSKYAYIETGTEAGISYYGSSLVLESETTIRHYFELTGEKTIDQYTFKLADGTELKPVQKGNYYYVDIENISAANLDKDYVLNVGGISLTYSAMCYVKDTMASENKAELINVVKALYFYNMSANKYFEQ